MTEPTQEPASAGALLRAAREKQGLHIAALAAAIKVSPRKLDALENDRWAELPDATFTRALAQTVCRTLKVDPRPVLEKLPAAAPVVLESHEAGLNAPFRDRPGRIEPGLAQSAVKPMVLGAAVLMLAAVAVYLLPSDLLLRKPAPTAYSAATAPPGPASAAAQDVASASAASGAAAAAPGASTPAAAMAPAFMPDAASAPAAGEPVFVAPPAATASQPAPVAAAAQAPAAATPSTAATAKPPAPAVAASGPLQLRATQSSWVEVRDGRGGTLLSRIVAAGETVVLDGPLPLRLTIGNAAGTQLVFKGQPVDLSTRTRDNVARVELP